MILKRRHFHIIFCEFVVMLLFYILYFLQCFFIIINVASFWKNVFRDNIILASPGFILLVFKSFNGFFMENIMISEHVLKLLEYIISNRSDFQRRRLEHVGNTCINMSVDMNALHSTAGPSFFWRTKRDWNNCPVFIIRLVWKISIFFQRGHNFVIIYYVQVDFWLI